MKFLITSKVRTSIALVFLAAPVAQAETGKLMREILNAPLAWGFIVAVIFLLMALFALNKALNTVRIITLKAQKSPEVDEVVEPVESSKSILQVLTDAKPVEREADILLDHDYDGIHELDNNLPPWWIWGFYITIGWAVVYLFVFLSGDSLSSEAAYKKEMAEEQQKVDAYLATVANSVDENNVVRLNDDQALAAGAKIFIDKCATCHLQDGGGSVGPNLTDAYWLHGGGITNVFTTIKYGVPAKGMISWKDQLSPAQMQQVASYVLSLEGSSPVSPKEPEGEIWTEEPPAAETEDAAATETPAVTTEESAVTDPAIN